VRYQPKNPIFDAFMRRESIEVFGLTRKPAGYLWSTWWRQYFHATVAPKLGVYTNGTRLPVTAHSRNEYVEVGDELYNWTLMPSGHGSKHRVHIECPCGRLIPAGRVHQHRCK